MMMSKEKLESRMYGLVPYNISPIQQAIQFGHAVVEYGLLHWDSNEYQSWARNDKTFIILNGGTTNKRESCRGTLNNHLDTLLSEHNMQVGIFTEPDLGDQLTAVVFILDERVWNKEKYPDPPPEPIIWQDSSTSTPMINKSPFTYEEAIEAMGGEKIWDLRQFMSQFRLA